MALRIGDLTAATSCVGTDMFEFSLAGSAGSRRITAAQLRTQLFAGGTGFTAADPLTCGALTATTVTATTGTFSGVMTSAVPNGQYTLLMSSVGSNQFGLYADTLGFYIRDVTDSHAIRLQITNAGAINVNALSATTGTFSGAVSGTTITGSSNVSAGATAGFFWTGRSRMVSNSDGEISFQSNAGAAANTVHAGITCTTISATTIAGTTGTFTGLIQTTLTTQQLGLRYDASNHLAVTVGSAGTTTFNLTGTNPAFVFSDRITVSGNDTTGNAAIVVNPNTAGSITPKGIAIALTSTSTAAIADTAYGIIASIALSGASGSITGVTHFRVDSPGTAGMTIGTWVGYQCLNPTGFTGVSTAYGLDITSAFRTDWNATPGNTRMLVWDVDNGALERVSVGVDDSGGAGFKVLRIPN